MSWIEHPQAIRYQYAVGGRINAYQTVLSWFLELKLTETRTFYADAPITDRCLKQLRSLDHSCGPTVAIFVGRRWYVISRVEIRVQALGHSGNLKHTAKT